MEQSNFIPFFLIFVCIYSCNKQFQKCFSQPACFVLALRKNIPFILSQGRKEHKLMIPAGVK